MVGPGKSMWLDDEIYDELWKEDEFSVNSESEFSDGSDCVSDMVVKFLSGSKQSDSSDDKDNVNYDSDIQHGTWTKVGTEWPHFPFSGKPGLNIDIEDPNNLLDYFEFLITPELVKHRNKPVCPTIFRKYSRLENKI
jgi:hypothetical protein